MKSSGLVYKQSARKHRRVGHSVRFWAIDVYGHTIYQWVA